MSTNDENAASSSNNNPNIGPRNSNSKNNSNNSSSARSAKIIVCCDGTSNSEYRSRNYLTNVSRIARCIPPRDGAGRRQIVKYLPGIGTSFQNPFRFLHQAVGGGMKDIIVTAYVFICDNFDGGDENVGGQRPRDEIVLIGFSRGAFAMRCLADLVSKFGILRKENIYKVHDLFDTWSKDRRPSGEDDRGQPAEITVCALWDTVSSLAHFPLLQRPAFSFVHSDLRHAGRYNFQALALHERRRAFYPVVMRQPKASSEALIPQQPEDGQGPQGHEVHLEQAWFAGFHTDVGGGNKNDALSHISLIWMMGKLHPWIDFTTDMLHHPHLLPLDGWKAARPHKPYSLLRDPMNPAWRLMGKRHRYPQTKFRNRTNWYRIQPSRRHCGTETVHFTVGAMQRVGLIGKVPRLDSHRTNRKWTVKVKRGRSRSRYANAIQEGSFVPNTWERKALARWVAWVLFDYDRSSLRAGPPESGDFLAVWALREAIGEHELAGGEHGEYSELDERAEIYEVGEEAGEGGDEEDEYPGIDEGSDGTRGSHHRLARLWRVGRLGRWGPVGRRIRAAELQVARWNQ